MKYSKYVGRRRCHRAKKKTARAPNSMRAMPMPPSAAIASLSGTSSMKRAPQSNRITNPWECWVLVARDDHSCEGIFTRKGDMLFLQRRAQGRKRHINFFNIKLFGTHPNPQLPQKKVFYVPHIRERTQKRDPHKLFRGDVGKKSGVPNGPFSATRS